MVSGLESIRLWISECAVTTGMVLLMLVVVSLVQRFFVHGSTLALEAVITWLVAAFGQFGALPVLAVMLGVFLTVHCLRMGHDIHALVMSVTAAVVIATKPDLASEPDPGWVFSAYLFLVPGIFVLFRSAWIAAQGASIEKYREDNSWWRRNAYWLLFWSSAFLTRAWQKYRRNQRLGAD